MQIEKKSSTWVVSGDITEQSSFDGVDFTPGNQTFDFEKVRIINSCGIRFWCESLLTHGITPTYVNCPPPIVDIFGMIPEFLGDEGIVQSFQVPLYCRQCGSNSIVTLELYKDFFPGQPFSMNNIARWKTLCCSPELDVDENAYFSFIPKLRETRQN